jgi:peptide chain release factor 2
MSPFNAGGTRETSFAAVEITPELPDADVISADDLDEREFRIDTYRASGAGGQHVNKTDSAVRITHLETGVVASCQSERSQRRNRENAMKFLKARLHAHYMEEERKRMEKIEQDKMDIAWGSQIRSYVLQPYTLVKDHRTNIEAGNVDAVLDGDIDLFIEGYLKSGQTVTRSESDEADNRTETE